MTMPRRSDDQPLVQGLTERIGWYTRRGAVVCAECRRWVAEETAESEGWHHRSAGLGGADAQPAHMMPLCPACAAREFSTISDRTSPPRLQ